MTNNTLAMRTSVISIFPIHWKVSSRIFFPLAFISAAALFVFCISQINMATEEGQEISQGEKRVVSLFNENEEMEINLIKANSTERIMPLIDKLNFEKVESFSYIKVLEGKVVVNNESRAE